jgi:hypothetical protein
VGRDDEETIARDATDGGHARKLRAVAGKPAIRVIYVFRLDAGERVAMHVTRW